MTDIQAVQHIDSTDDERETMIKVDHVSMVFNMASEQLNSLKEYTIAIARRKLSFQKLHALDDISFEVKRGDVLGIMGTNGSGKSTLLKIIAGVLDPTSGTCSINGNIAPLIELGAGFDIELTARENIYLNGALLGYSKEFINEHFEEIVAFAEIKPFLDMPIKNYSSGMVARIAFAVATVIVPDILIVDEVLSVGDFMFQQKCERRIDTLIREHQVTVLIVSHNEDQIERLCTRAIWIEKGHMRLEGDTKAVCDHYRVLGGHTGSAESEKRLYQLMKSPVEVPDAMMETISADNQYGTTVHMLEHNEDLFDTGTVVLASSDDARLCLSATSIAGCLKAPLLLIGRDLLPDMTAQALKRLRPRHVIVVGGDGYISRSVLGHIEQVCECPIEVLNGPSFHDIAKSAFYQFEDGGVWGNRALVTHTRCIADYVSFEPFVYSAKVPVFFAQDSDHIDEETFELLTSGRFSEILVLGGPDAFPASVIDSLATANTRCTQIYGRNEYDANLNIRHWLMENWTEMSLEQVFISSAWMPENGFAIGPYAGAQQNLVVLEDPRDLDSVANTAEFLRRHQSEIEKLIFIGDDKKYSGLDKEILGKALCGATFD